MLAPFVNRHLGPSIDTSIGVTTLERECEFFNFELKVPAYATSLVSEKDRLEPDLEAAKKQLAHYVGQEIVNVYGFEVIDAPTAGDLNQKKIMFSLFMEKPESHTKNKMRAQTRERAHFPALLPPTIQSVK